MLAVAVLAHKFRLNKPIALAASNVSFPLAAPFILAAGLVLGHFLWTGDWVEFQPERVVRQIPLYLWEWLFGSVVLAILAGLAGGLGTWLLAKAFWRTDSSVQTCSGAVGPVAQSSPAASFSGISPREPAPGETLGKLAGGTPTLPGSQETGEQAP